MHQVLFCHLLKVVSWVLSAESVCLSISKLRTHSTSALGSTLTNNRRSSNWHHLVQRVTVIHEVWIHKVFERPFPWNPCALLTKHLVHVLVVCWSSCIVLVQRSWVSPCFKQVSVHMGFHLSCVCGILWSEVSWVCWRHKWLFIWQGDIQTAQAVSSFVRSTHRSKRRQLCLALWNHRVFVGHSRRQICGLLKVINSVSKDDVLEVWGLLSILLTQVAQLPAFVNVLISRNVAVFLPHRDDPGRNFVVHQLALLVLVLQKLVHLFLHHQLLVILLTF